MAQLSRNISQYLIRCLIMLPFSLLIGVFFGGISTNWMPEFMFKGSMIGIVFVIVLPIGTVLFRHWALPVRHSSNFAREGILFTCKLVAVWLGQMLVILPVVHWVVGHPVFFYFNNILPLASCSLAGVAIQMVAYTAANLYRTAGELARSEARAEFLVLKAQLQPHTLFNALNGITGLIREHPREAEDAVRRLASLMRRILEGLDQPCWTLADEFAVIEDLLRLETLRFGDRLKTNIVLNELMASREIPPLSVLPLVENSLRHGFRTKVGSCSLRVEAANGNVQVEDDGVGFDPNWHEGVGLRTVRERIEAEGGRLRYPATSSGACVELRLP